MSFSHFVFLRKKFVQSVFLKTASEVFKLFINPNPASCNFESMENIFLE